MGKKYLDTKENTLESSILGVWSEAAKKVAETNKNNKSDDGKGLDAVQPKAVKKKFDDRKDKDIDNDGDTDSSDKFLHKKRKAISKAMKDEGNAFGMALKAAKDKGEKTFVVAGKKYDVKEAVDLDEGYLELTFKSKQDAEKAYNKINNEIFAAGVVPYDDMNQEGNEIQFDLDGNLNRRNDILKDLKSGGIKNFKVTANEDLDEGTKEEYEKFFNGALKKFKIDSPADLKSDEEKKKFFNYIDKNYTGEKDEDFESRLKETIGIEESFEIGTNEYRDHALDVTPGETDPEWAQARDFKVASMKEALAKIWGMEEGKNPFIKKEDDDKALTKGTKSGITMTGKKAAIIDTKPKIKD